MSTQKNSKPADKKNGAIPKKETKKGVRLLTKPIPLYIFILIFIPLASVGFFFYPSHLNSHSSKVEINQLDSNAKEEVEIGRESDTGLVHPLLYVDVENEKMLNPTKTKINSYLEQKNREGAFTSASVYLNDLTSGVHIEINPDELYDPASIMKVPCLLIYLKEVESHPELMKRKYIFKPATTNLYASTIKDQTLEKGKSYTVEELLYYMIVYSDNEAFWLLCDNIDNMKFENLNKELGIPKNMDKIIHPNNGGQNFVANVGSVSRYFSVLYNATYLNKKWSSYAINLLTHSNYRDGMLKGIDQNIKVAHKFGERIEIGQAEFHEFGIVYLKNHPYLIGIMTRGKQLNPLQNTLSELSRIVFDEMKRM